MSTSKSSSTCRWTECPSELITPDHGFKLWPFDKSLSEEDRDNAMARLILFGTLGTALYARDSRVLLTGAGLLALLGIIGSEPPKQKSSKLHQMTASVPPVTIDPSQVNVTAMGIVPVQIPEVPLYDCPTMTYHPQQYPTPPNTSSPIDQFAKESADYLVASMSINEDNRNYNPYGNPNVYQAYYAIDGNLPKQPNEMDVHAQLIADGKMDIQKMFGPNGQLDEGLFVNPLPDPTLQARPVFFPESSDADTPIWDGFMGSGNAYRQTM